MKQAVNFRLTNRAISTLCLLESKMHTSKTDIVEKALQFYAAKELSRQSELLGFAGILSDQEADAMLMVIRSNKNNKELKVKL